jgi:hypothetical protein
MTSNNEREDVMMKQQKRNDGKLHYLIRHAYAVPQTSTPIQSNGWALSLRTMPSPHRTALSNAGDVDEELREKVASRRRPYELPLESVMMSASTTHPPPNEMKPVSHRAMYWFRPVQRKTWGLLLPASNLNMNLNVS